MVALGQWSFVVQLQGLTAERNEALHSDGVRIETHSAKREKK